MVINPVKSLKTLLIGTQSALFNFQSLLLVILLLICTSTYCHAVFPSFLDGRKGGVLGIFWKFARIGERLSPYVSICCVAMAVSIPEQRHTLDADSLL
jgi:hypothetical protein